MLDPRLFIDQLEVLEKGLAKKNFPDEEISKIVAASKRRKELIQETEALKAKRNAGSQLVGQLKAKAKTDPSASAEADRLMVEMREIGDRSKVLDEELKLVQEHLDGMSLRLPNIPTSRYLPVDLLKKARGSSLGRAKEVFISSERPCRPGRSAGHY